MNITATADMLSLLSSNPPLPPHSSHPSFLNLAGLVSEAVLEVVFVALPGFLVAYTGMFDAHSQKFVAELNTMVFTPCLIFTKLAGQLDADKLADLVVIPFVFAAQTLVSYASASLMARVWGFGGRGQRRQRNFVLAMGVFGNSNSLPISLVLSLSKTIQGLHWDKVPGDNDNEVAARGILYLLIFQQLGQLLRWTWGYSVLLKPREAFDEEDEEEEERERLAAAAAYHDDDDEEEEEEDERRIAQQEEGRYRDEPDDLIAYSNGNTKPERKDKDAGAASDDDERDRDGNRLALSLSPSPPRSNGLYERARSTGHMTTFPHFATGGASATTISHHKPSSSSSLDSDSRTGGWKADVLRPLQRFHHNLSTTTHTFLSNQFRRLPPSIAHPLRTFSRLNNSFWRAVWRQMNPPLWAMLASLIVASVPPLKHLFFTRGTFVSNSITSAIAQSGGVAVPLILVVLGANLARSTLPQSALASTPAEKSEERRLLYASLIARMLIPTIIMAPLLALAAKYVPVSILDDPIFVIVCFLLTGAPSALQLAQICQINGVFMGVMSSLLTASYVVAIFPSTLCLVMLALEVVEWAQR